MVSDVLSIFTKPPTWLVLSLALILVCVATATIIRLLPRLFPIGFTRWKELTEELENRSNQFQRKPGHLNKRANHFQLQAADIFVEKALVHLTERARFYFGVGWFFATITLTILILAIWMMYSFDVGSITGGGESVDWSIVTLHFFKGVALTGFTGGAIYFCGSLSRAYFHEATSLFQRRHAVRFGRLYIYLKYGEAYDERKILMRLLEDVKKLPWGQDTAGDEGKKAPPSQEIEQHLLTYLLHRDVSAEELERAFGWNLQIHTAFRDIKPEVMSATLYNRIVDTLGRALERTSRARSEVT